MSPKRIREWAYSMRKEALISELESRGLSISGIVPVLRERLYKYEKNKLISNDSGIDVRVPIGFSPIEEEETAAELNLENSGNSLGEAAAILPDESSNRQLNIFASNNNLTSRSQNSSIIIGTQDSHFRRMDNVVVATTEAATPLEHLLDLPFIQILSALLLARLH